MRSQCSPVISNEDALVAQGVLRVKLAVTLLEFPDLRNCDDAVLAVGPVEPPLAGLGIVQAQCETLDAPVWTVGQECVELGSPTPERVAAAGPGQVDPVR